ncbi:hypothetical protein L7F22_020547, partial [Adiantum nelumboides]|nr:hypothetical protein [Adiantum nelumboides]
MDDIDKDKVDIDMQEKKGIETNEEEGNEEVPLEDDLGEDEIPDEQEEKQGKDNLKEEKEEIGEVLEGGGPKAKEDDTTTSS